MQIDAVAPISSGHRLDIETIGQCRKERSPWGFIYFLLMMLRGAIHIVNKFRIFINLDPQYADICFLAYPPSA